MLAFFIKTENMISTHEIALKYIQFLEKGETENIIALFSSTGQVNSPLYGIKNAKTFYTQLNEDTLNSKLVVNNIFENTATNSIALYFTFHWTLKNNKKVVFDVVDIIEFNQNNEITMLTIIYDTVVARRLHEDVRPKN